MVTRKISAWIGAAVTACVFAAAPGPARAEAQRVDVHVHLRGTTQSGMLGGGGGIKPGGGGRKASGSGLRPAGRPGEGRSRDANLEAAAGNLIRKMDRHGVEKALVVVVPGPHADREEYESMRKITGRYGKRLGLLAGGARLSYYLQEMDPGKVTDADRRRFRRIAEEILANGAAGFGEMISFHLSMAGHHSFQYAPPDHPNFLLLADIAAERGVPVDLHMEAVVERRPTPANLLRASAGNPRTLEPTIPAFERLLAHNRKARIVWQHIGWDNTGDMTAGLVARLLGAHPNLYIALRVENRTRQVGNGPAMPNRLVDGRGALDAEWRAVIERFSDRVVIGSDEFFFPVEHRRPNQSFDKTWSLLDQLPAGIATKIGSENPRLIYNLE